MRIAWIALTMVITCAALGQTQPLTLVEKSRPSHKTTVDKRQKAPEDQRGTEQRPLFVKVVDTPAIKLDSGAKIEEKPAEREDDSQNTPVRYWGFPADAWTAWFTLGLLIIGIVTAAFLVYQSILISRQITLAREEFLATHRPKIIVRGFYMMTPELNAGERARFVFVAHNIGDTPATVVEVRSATAVLKVDEKIPNNSGIPNPEKFNCMLVSGGHEVFPGNGGNVIDDIESMDIDAGNCMLICVGAITYIDGAKVKRETRFCRGYRSRERSWEVIESEYEYAY